MSEVRYAVYDGVAHIDVGRRHVNLGAEHTLAVGELARPHPLEQIEVFLHRTVAIRAFGARLRESAAGGAYLVGGEVAHIRLARANEPHRALVHLLEIV